MKHRLLLSAVLALMAIPLAAQSVRQATNGTAAFTPPKTPWGDPDLQGIYTSDDYINVAFARQAYNDSVMAYNNRREVFPSSLIAGMFGFTPAALFEVDDPQQRQAPQVSF